MTFDHTYSHPSLEQITSKENLYCAYLEARKEKHEQPQCQEFERFLSQNIDELHHSILNQEYCPCHPREFVLFCKPTGKWRNISAPQFRDSVVQHAIYRVVYPLFDRSFIHDNYGCRKGKGNHRASNKCQQFMRNSPSESYYLQIDIKKYYPSMNHDVLKNEIQRKIKDQRIVELMMVFPEITKHSKRTGMGIGFLLSQLFGMVYLNRFDHWVKRHLRIKHYIRYVDDMVFIGYSRKHCKELLTKLSGYLYQQFFSTLSKWKVQRLSKGINFVGYRTWRTRKFIRKRTLYNFSKALRKGNIDSIQSILAHSLETSSYTYLLNRTWNELTIDQINKLPERYKHDLLVYQISGNWTNRKNENTQKH